MSTGITSDPRDPKVPVVQQVAFAFAGFIALGAMLYFGFGRELFEEFEREAQSTQNAEDDAASEVEGDAEVKTQNDSPQATKSGASLNSASERLLNQRLDETDSELHELKQQIAILLNERNERLDAQARQAALPLDSDVGLNRARLQEAHEIGVTITNELAAYKEEIERCTQVRNDLAQTVAGRRVAANPDLVAKYASLLRSDTQPDIEFAAFEKPYVTVLAGIKSAYDTDDYTVTVRPADVDFLRQFLARIRTLRISLALHKQSLEYLISSSLHNEPGEQTLKEAVVALEQQAIAEYLEGLVGTDREVADSIADEYKKKIAESHSQMWNIVFQHSHEAEAEWLGNIKPLPPAALATTTTFTRLSPKSLPPKPYSPVRRRCRCP